MGVRCVVSALSWDASLRVVVWGGLCIMVWVDALGCGAVGCSGHGGPLTVLRIFHRVGLELLVVRPQILNRWLAKRHQLTNTILILEHKNPVGEPRQWAILQPLLEQLVERVKLCQARVHYRTVVAQPPCVLHID